MTSNLINPNTGVKINGAYYRDVLLGNYLLLAIRYLLIYLILCALW